jgi:hypothetical protein
MIFSSGHFVTAFPGTGDTTANTVFSKMDVEYS